MSRPEDELTFIAGGDRPSACPSWREPEALLSLAPLAVAERAGRRARARSSAAVAAAGRVRPRATSSTCRASTSPRRSCASASRRPPDPLPRPDAGRRRDRAERLVLPHDARADRARPSSPRRSRLAADKKAIELVELDVRGMLGYTDHFVICTGNTDRQVKAIHDGIPRA